MSHRAIEPRWTSAGALSTEMAVSRSVPAARAAVAVTSAMNAVISAVIQGPGTDGCG